MTHCAEQGLDPYEWIAELYEETEALSEITGGLLLEVTALKAEIQDLRDEIGPSPLVQAAMSILGEVDFDEDTFTVKLLDGGKYTETNEREIQ